MAISKKRHWLLTAFLVVAIIINGLAALTCLSSGSQLIANIPGSPEWALPILILGPLFNIACLVGVFSWKKWGFYGIMASALLLFALNVQIGVGLAQSLAGLLGIAVFYGVLQIGGDHKGWAQLE